MKKITWMIVFLAIVVPGAAAAETITVPISESLDDVWEEEGFVYNTQRLDTEGVVGLRFTGIDIPPRSAITHAYIEMTFIDTGGGDFFDTWLWVAADINPSQFVQIDYNVTSRPTVPLAVPWNVDFSDYAGWLTGETKQTPDVTDLVQKIVNRTSFNGTMMFFITPDRGDAVFASSTHSFYEGPQLVIDYIPSGQMYEVALPSGGAGQIEMSATAGDVWTALGVLAMVVMGAWQQLRDVAHRAAR